MKISNSFSTNSYNQNFNGKMRTRILLETISGHFVNINKTDNADRFEGISSITDIPVKKLKTKLKDEIDLKIYIDAFGRFIGEKFPELFEESRNYTDDLFKMLFAGQLGSRTAFNKIADKYDKKLGRFVDINIDEGEKLFFNKYLDMFE